MHWCHRSVWREQARSGTGSAVQLSVLPAQNESCRLSLCVQTGLLASYGALVMKELMGESALTERGDIHLWMCVIEKVRTLELLGNFQQMF